MYLSLADVMQLPIMRSAIMRTASGAGHRAVQWVSVIEMPVENFVRTDEFVLTTAMGCGRNPALLAQFVNEIISAQPAALGIATGPHLDSIPEEILREAESRGFPIVELPWEVRFSEITEALSEAFRNEQAQLFQRARQLQTKLLDAIIQGGAFSGLSQVISRELGRTVLIVDRRFTVLGRSGDTDELERSLQASTLERLEAIPGGAKPDVAQPYLVGSDLMRFPIRSSQEVEGYLILANDAQTAGPADALRQLLEHAATACAFWFLQQNAVRETESRMRDDFIWNLAKGQMEREEAIARGLALGYDLKSSYICILARPDNLDQVAGALHRDNPLAADIRLRQMVEDQLHIAADRLGQSVMTTYQRETLLIYLKADSDAATKAAGALVELAERRLKEAVPGLIVSWGIGDGARRVEEFTDGYTEAKEALDLGYRLSGPGHRTYCRDTPPYRVLMRMAEEPEARRLVRDALSVLEEYDNRKHGALISTLHTFIRHRSQISETARSLNLHRQSLLYRLQKIESLTGRSLECPEDWFTFRLALELRAVMGDASSDI